MNPLSTDWARENSSPAYERTISEGPMVRDIGVLSAMRARSEGLEKVPLDFVRWCPEIVEHAVEHGHPLHMRLLKRTVDILLGLAGVIALVLLLPLIACLIKFDSPGPVFYTQRRVGYRDRPFTLVKFRSMRVNAESQGAVFAAVGDPRVTPVGAFLRRSRLDELPQVWNILKGEMSVIGPRPERPEHIPSILEHIPEFSMRTCVKPGLTGWAQTHYKYAGTMTELEKKLEFDLYYILFPSMLVETRILLKTVRMTFGSHGQ